MTQEDKMLLIKDLSSRLPYSVHVQHTSGFSGTLHDISMHHKYDKNDNVYDIICYIDFFGDGDSITIEHFKPYLFPLSSMTEEEAKELSILYGIKDILSINITDEYIDFKVDDGFCSFERKIIWYNEIISSTETFDWLNKNHFDYRGLIEKGLAIDATGLNIY